MAAHLHDAMFSGVPFRGHGVDQRGRPLRHQVVLYSHVPTPTTHSPAPPILVPRYGRLGRE